MSNSKLFPPLLLVVTFTCAAIFASDDTCCTSLSADPSTYLCPDRGFSLLLPNVIAPKSFLFLVEHRGHSPAFANPLRDGFGFDNGALKIGLGLRYSPADNLDAGVRRVNNGLDLFDTYEFDARYRVLNESNRFLDAAIDAGLSLFTQDVDGIASGFFVHMGIGKSVMDRVYCATGGLYHSNSTFFAKTTADIDWSLSVPAFFSLRTIAGLFFLTEWNFPIAGYSAGYPGYGVGVKYATWRHSFSLLLANTSYTTMDGVAAGSDRLNNPVLGFIIVRKFGED